MLGTLAVLLGLTACGAANHPTAGGSSARPVQPSRTIVLGAQTYQGAANLRKWENQAAAHPHDPQAQLQAGIAAFQNHQPQKAIAYYQQAAALNPHSGVAYNDIGNVYRIDFNNLPKAESYYERAVQADPHYDYGWYNLLLAQIHLGQRTAAQATAQQALRVLPANDPLRTAIQQLATALAHPGPSPK